MYSPLDAVREQVGLSAAGYVLPPANAGPPTPARIQGLTATSFWTLRAGVSCSGRRLYWTAAWP